MDGGYSGTGTTGTTGYTGADTTTGGTTGTGTTGTTGHHGHHGHTTGEHAGTAWRRLRAGMLNSSLHHTVAADELLSCRLWPDNCGEGQGNGARNPGDLRHCKSQSRAEVLIQETPQCLKHSCLAGANTRSIPALFSHLFINAAAGEQGGYQTQT